MFVDIILSTSVCKDEQIITGGDFFYVQGEIKSSSIFINSLFDVILF